MKPIRLKGDSIDAAAIRDALGTWLESAPSPLRKVLILPPDFTRFHSQAGLITRLLWEMLTPGVQVDIMPALGTHMPVSEPERLKMFGPGIPAERFFVHDWRRDIIKIGQVPGDFVHEVSGGVVGSPVDVEVNRRLLDPSYDLIISVGQVVPHEVVGMANHNKNVFVGCGGSAMINQSHFLGAAFGMERMMGRDHTPVRKVFDYAETHFLPDAPVQYILTVNAAEPGGIAIKALFAGRERSLFEEAVTLSQQHNLDLLPEPLQKVVVFLDPEEFKSTWLGNKAVYRTRMAIADGGELVIIAPGLKQFGEDAAIDSLIRKYGYAGTPRVLELVEKEADLAGNLSAAAHLIHGSSEGRFRISYAPGHLTRDEINGVHFEYLDLQETLNRYQPSGLRNGFNITREGEAFFYISNPALGLWALKEKFAQGVAG